MASLYTSCWTEHRSCWTHSTPIIAAIMRAQEKVETMLMQTTNNWNVGTWNYVIFYRARILVRANRNPSRNRPMVDRNFRFRPFVAEKPGKNENKWIWGVRHLQRWTHFRTHHLGSRLRGRLTSGFSMEWINAKHECVQFWTHKLANNDTILKELHTVTLQNTSQRSP